MDLLGWSMGGAMAAQYVLEDPARVRAAVFMAPHIYGIERFNPFQALGDLPFGIGRAMSWNSVGGSPNGFAARMCEADATRCGWLEPLRIKGTVDGLRAISATPQDSRLPADVSLIRTPALVIAGETDEIVPAADTERLVAALGADYFVAEGAGHFPMEREPDRVARRILDYLAARAGNDGA
jgi:pimeloyl-ACP methyl ester carboxylesterase